MTLKQILAGAAWLRRPDRVRGVGCLRGEDGGDAVNNINHMESEMTKTIDRADVAEQFIVGINAPGFSIHAPKSSGFWSVSCYWPNGDVVRDTGCYGTGPTLAEAISNMWEKVEKAKAAQHVLKTAAECKAAVIALINEHDAAPASFRDAVDALPVKP